MEEFMKKMFETADPKVREAMLTQKASMDRLRKAENQFFLWKKELTIAEELYKASEKSWTDMLNKVDGNGLFVENKEEI